MTQVVSFECYRWYHFSAMIIYAFISIIIASMVIICTLSVVKIIELSPVLNFILFGINPKGK